MTKPILIVLLLSVFFASSCVTQTERLPYRRYVPPPEDEGIIEELRREFGWPSSPSPYRDGDPFYKRAAQGIKNTVSGWFQPEDVPGAMTQEEREQARRKFEQEQQEALRRLRERQEQERTAY